MCIFHSYIIHYYYYCNNIIFEMYQALRSKTVFFSLSLYLFFRLASPSALALSHAAVVRRRCHTLVIPLAFSSTSSPHTTCDCKRFRMCARAARRAHTLSAALVAEREYKISVWLLRTCKIHFVSTLILICESWGCVNTYVECVHVETWTYRAAVLHSFLVSSISRVSS